MWDIIGRTALDHGPGGDVPGRIARLPGGVALNIAVALAHEGLRPAVLTAVGQDVEGTALVAAVAALGIETAFAFRPDGLPTDCYMAVEGPAGLIAAVADAHTLEAAGAAILAPLRDGRLGSAAAPWAGPIALDGNLTQALLAEIAIDPAFAAADLRIAPASPGKAGRLAPLLCHPRATLYLNLHEAAALAGLDCPAAEVAAVALVARGARRVIVTDGGRPAAEAGAAGTRAGRPPEVTVRRITGAGDALMAAHIAAELAGAGPDDAFAAALSAAARHVSGAG